MINEDFQSAIAVLKAFPTEESCIAHLEKIRWNGTIVSPFDPFSRIYICKGKKYRCQKTGKYFNVKTGTIFYNSKIELQKWFLAIWIVTVQKKGITSVELSQDLNITQKTAWYMLQRIKAYFGSEEIVASKLPLKQKSRPQKMKTIEEIEVIEEKDKFQMLEWLQLLKNNG